MGLTFLLLLAVVCGVFLLLYAAVALIQDRRFFSSAPKDVQAVVQDHPERFPGVHVLGWALAAVAIVLILGSLVLAVYDGTRRGWGVWELFLRFLIILDGYKVWDMLFLDRYLLTRSHFFQRYYPEVEGVASMQQAGFNTRSQLVKLLVVFPLVSLALAVVVSFVA